MFAAFFVFATISTFTPQITSALSAASTKESVRWSGANHSRLKRYPEMLVANTSGFQASAENSNSGESTRHTIAWTDDNRTYAPGVNKDEEPAARLIVLTMDRSEPLKRLLRSLSEADYGGDHVDLDIWVDRAVGKDINRDVLKVAGELDWKQGTKTVHSRLENGGLYQQWIYTWRITEQTDEAVVILEDDLEVSKAFYQWLKQARSAYASDPEVASFTLQRSTLRPRQIPGVAAGPLRLPKEHTVFKYRLLGTWGFSPQRDAWVEFREWFEKKKRNKEKPYVPNLMTTNWYKSQEKDGFAPTMWSQWWIKFVDEKNYFTVTAHLPDGSTLAANWRESGMHYTKRKASRDFPLYNGTADQFLWPESPIKIDWDGREIKQ